MTFATLCAQEPGLRALADEVKEVWVRHGPPAGRGPFCANSFWFGYDHDGRGIKERLSVLVGWEAANPALRSEEAYDVAYDALYAALPDCRGCGCMSVADLRG